MSDPPYKPRWPEGVDLTPDPNEERAMGRMRHEDRKITARDILTNPRKGRAARKKLDDILRSVRR